MGLVTDKLQSRYTRQLTGKVTHGVVGLIGENATSPSDFGGNYIELICEWDDIDPPPTTGQVKSPRGTTIEYDLPLECRDTVEFKVHDWDMDQYNQLNAWKFARTQLRWYVPGSHFVVGKILQVKRSRPKKSMMEVTMSCKGQFFYLTDDAAVINAPFPNTTKLVTDGEFYGEQS